MGAKSVCSRTLVLVAIVVLTTLGRPHRLHAGCNIIPPAVTTFRGTLGSTDKPFATPGDWVTISLDPTCAGAAPVFTGPASDYVVLWNRSSFLTPHGLSR